MNRTAGWKSIVAAAGMLALVDVMGCQNAPQSNNDPNQAMKTQYEAGTGVGSSSYQAKPRLYSGQGTGTDAVPVTQPAAP